MQELRENDLIEDCDSIDSSRIRRRVLVPFAGGLAVLMAVLATGFYLHDVEHFQHFASARLESLERAFAQELDHDANMMKGLIGLLEKDKDLQEAYSARDEIRYSNWRRRSSRSCVPNNG